MRFDGSTDVQEHHCLPSKDGGAEMRHKFASRFCLVPRFSANRHWLADPGKWIAASSKNFVARILSFRGNSCRDTACWETSRRVRAAICCLALLLLSWHSVGSAAAQPIVFDAPAIVVAEPINPEVVAEPTMGGELLRLRITLSTVIAPDFRGTIQEYLVEIHSPGQTLRIVDFWPKDEAYSEFEGAVNVEASRQKDEHFSFNLGASYPTIGHAQASGDYRNRMDVQESYRRRPPMQAVTSSGTIRQGFGVFYKFRPGPVDILEGSRQIALLVEAPRGWRADMLQVAMTAAGANSSNPRSATAQQRGSVLASQRFWMTTHREGDAAAAAQALAYVRHERHVRGLAASKQEEIDRRSAPSLLRTVGLALNAIEPRTPKNYLEQVIYGPADPSFGQGGSRLPIDLRIAILDYWDQRSDLIELSRSRLSVEPSLVSTN
jgi:hypothetical protein